MSVLESRAHSSTNHRLLERQRKRKLNEYAPFISDPDDPLRMRSCFTPHDDSRVRVSSASSSSSSSSSFELHFFVRVMSQTLVVHAEPDDTVESLIEKIGRRIGIPMHEQHRLIYSGRQLQGESTLAECAINKDAILELIGRLRSTRYHKSWQIVNDLVSTACRIGGDDCSVVKNSGARNLETLVNEFLLEFPKIPDAGPVNNFSEWKHVEVFVLAGAPAALVKLYLSPFRPNRALAERAIRLFLNSNSEYLTKDRQTECVPIVLEFCKLLAGTVGRKDQLYAACRSTLGSLLEAHDLRQTNHSKPMRYELLPFVSELAGTVMAGLSSESMWVSSGVIIEFSNFLVAMRRAVQDWMGTTCPIPKSSYKSAHERCEDWIGPLHGVFKELLKKVGEYLKKVEDSLAEKGQVQSESRWITWANVLFVLKEVNVFSKIYEDGRELFHSVLVVRRSPLNALIRRAKRSDKLRWLLKYKDVTDFEARRNLVLMMFPEGKDEYDELHEMLIDRSQLLAESFEYISQADANALHGGLFMEFKNEEATGPGVLREWFCLLCRALFNPQNVLFLACPKDRRRFFPNPASVVDPLHLKYFGFCGRVIALALMHNVQVGIMFDRVFFQQLAGELVSLEDVKDADPSLYMSCKQILEMDSDLLDSDALGLTFVREIEELGSVRAVELCPGGKDIVVNSRNRQEYVDLLIQHRFVTSISEQVAHFAKGFGDILSSSKVQTFFFQSLDLEDFDRMLGGSDNVINVGEWKAHTEYDGYRAKDREICWFWKIVESMSPEQRRVLLFFWTSVKYLPVDGFGGLASKLYIYKNSNAQDHLPTSHTCFFRLCIPQYPSISIMRDRLQLITQEHVSCTFGLW